MSATTLAARLQYAGGPSRIERINAQKRKSLHHALENDYNSRLVKVPNKSAFSVLINEDNLKPDYDRKIVSADFDTQLESGDVFEVLEDGVHWMVYLPHLTETAYLKADIIRCRYQIEIEGEQYWIYFQGPTETDIRWIMKNSMSHNELNLSGTIFIKNTPTTKNYFKRFSHLKIDGQTWEVQVSDSISVPGVLELEVQEFYNNPIGELPKIHKEHEPHFIIGQREAEQDSTIGYMIPSEKKEKDSKWLIKDNSRVEILETFNDNTICKVKIHPGAIRNFTICYGKHELPVTIKYKQVEIEGPEEIYPYDKVKYSLAWGQGHFSTDSPLVKLIQLDEGTCEVTVLSGKKGQFTLTCDKENGEQVSLEVKILSF